MSGVYTPQKKKSFSTCRQEAAKLPPFCTHTQIPNLVPAPAMKQNRRIKATCPIQSHLCWGPEDHQINWFISQMLEVWPWCQQAVQSDLPKSPCPCIQFPEQTLGTECIQLFPGRTVAKSGRQRAVWMAYVELIKLYCSYELPVTRNGDDIGNHCILSLNIQSSKHLFAWLLLSMNNNIYCY